MCEKVRFYAETPILGLEMGGKLEKVERMVAHKYAKHRRFAFGNAVASDAARRHKGDACLAPHASKALWGPRMPPLSQKRALR